MQESRLKKIEKTDVLATLRNFSVGDVEFVKYSDSHITTNSWCARCCKLRSEGILDSAFSFKDVNVEEKRGTIIVRIK